MTSARRQAELVVSLSESDHELIEGRLPPHVVKEMDRFGRYLTVVSTDSLTGDAAETHLDWLWEKSSPLLTSISDLKMTPMACVLRVIEYVSADDEIGAGVPIDEKWVAAIARLRGSIDIDIYVD